MKKQLAKALALIMVFTSAMVLPGCGESGAGEKKEAVKLVTDGGAFFNETDGFVDAVFTITNPSDEKTAAKLMYRVDAYDKDGNLLEFKNKSDGETKFVLNYLGPGKTFAVAETWSKDDHLWTEYPASFGITVSVADWRNEMECPEIELEFHEEEREEDDLECFVWGNVIVRNTGSADFVHDNEGSDDQLLINYVARDADGKIVGGGGVYGTYAGDELEVPAGGEVSVPVDAWGPPGATLEFYPCIWTA